MSRREPSDIGASVRQRLLNLSRETGDDFQLVLNRYALERFLFRLGRSPHRERFVLKGAMLFSLWGGSIFRPTRDLDLHGSGDSSVADVIRRMRDVASVESAEDGLVIDIDSIAGEEIREDQEYDGVRVTLEARLSGAKAHLQIDVGFGDAVVPEATDGEYPTLLGMPAPWIRVYPRETVVAEKFHAIVVLGIANSRMKDFHDLRILSKSFPFDGKILSDAIKGTFDRRRTPLPSGLPVVHLGKLGIPFDLVAEEVERMKEVAFARTANRQVLGVMNEYAFMTKTHLQRMGQTPNHVSFLLADGVVGPLKERSPAGEARNLLFDARRRATFGVVPIDSGPRMQ